MPESFSMPPAPPEIIDAEWYYVVGGQRQGPFGHAEMMGRLAEGFFTAETLAWRQGMLQWAPMGSIPDFAPHVQSVLRPNPATWIIGLHDKGQSAYHQGRLIGSIDSMVFGFLSFIPLIGLAFALMALPVATKAIRKGRSEPNRYSGYGMAVAGMVLSIISIVGHGLAIAVPLIAANLRHF